MFLLERITGQRSSSALGALFIDLSDVTASTIDKLTLVVAGVAAISSICAAIVGGSLQRRMQRSHWLQEAQMAAYQAFYRAIWQSYDEVVAGAVNRSLQDPSYSGLDETWPLVQGQISEAFDRYHDILVVAARPTLEASGRLVAWWQREASVAVPLKGTTTPHVLEERNEVLRRCGALLLDLSLTMRKDLEVLARREQRDWKSRRPDVKELLTDTRPVGTLSEMYHHLASRGIRTLDGGIPDPSAGYYASQTREWVAAHTNFSTPRAALLIKPSDENWHLGVASDLAESYELAVIADIIHLVRHHGRTLCELGGNTWKPLPDGGSARWWPRSE